MRIAGDDHLTGLVLERAKRMRIISKWGIGTDGIDLGAAARLGIQVTSTPGCSAMTWPTWLPGYLVMLARQLHMIDRSVRDGTWRKHRGVALSARTWGFLALGASGPP